MRNYMPKYTGAGIAAVCLWTGGCQAGISQETAYQARVPNAPVSFTLSERFVRTSFDDFCRSPEAGGRCADISHYEIELGVNQYGVLVLAFVLRQGAFPPSARPLAAFVCEYLRGQRTCRTGDHRY